MVHSYCIYFVTHHGVYCLSLKNQSSDYLNVTVTQYLKAMFILIPLKSTVILIKHRKNYLLTWYPIKR